MNNSHLIKIIITLLLMILISPNLLLSNDYSFKWKIGEELIYKVKWSFIRLGTIKLQICDTLVVNSTRVYHVKLFIDSNPLLFFVNIHNVYNSYINENFQLHHFFAEEKIDDVTYNAEYRFNYSVNLIYIKMTDINDPTKTIEKSMPFKGTILDGTSLVFYARKYAISTKNDTVTSFFESERGKVAFNFTGKTDRVKLSALDSPIESYYIDGEIKTKGIAGVTGPYKGWFALGKQRPPLKAELKVFIGNVKIELEKWKGWEPKY